MTRTVRASRRSINLAIVKAIEGGRHRVDILPDDRVTILPLGVDRAQADGIALDAEIEELIRSGDVRG